MRIQRFGLAVLVMVMLAGCTSVTVVRRGPRDDMTEGPARVVNADELGEEGGALSKPVLPERAGAQEREEPPFEVKRARRQVDPDAAEGLLAGMKPEVQKRDADRAEKFEQLVRKVRIAASTQENITGAQKKYEEAEKLYSLKKYDEAVAAYLKVLKFVPTHRKAQQRLRECYADIDKVNERARAERKPVTARDILLLEQKFLAAIRLYEDAKLDEALAKFTEVVEMIEWSSTRVDMKNRLKQARNYIKRIEIEKKLADEQEKEAKTEKKPAKEPQKPGQKIEEKPEPAGKSTGGAPGTGDTSTH